MDDDVLLTLAATLARRAAAAIMAVRAGGFVVENKSDASPVTAADHAAEAVILAGLREPATGDEFWLIDPLDGTREFAAGSDEFTVNIGLVRHGRPVLGAVAVPALDELFGGIVGRGAWKETRVGRHAIATRACPEEGATVLASRHHGSDTRLEEYLAGKHVASVVHMGSALKFLRLAEGAADLYPRFGRTMEWDTGAPQAVLEAAGGFVEVVGGAPLGYRKPGWENPAFFCRGR